MLLKKLGAIAATGALLLAVATPAFADVNITNHGSVGVETGTVSNSGANNISGNDEGTVDGSNITTGVSVANSTIGSELNNNSVAINDQTGGNSDAAEVNIHNCGEVNVEALTVANSGANNISAEEDGGSVSDSSINAGNASAGSNVQSLVNVNSVSVTTSGGSDL